MQHNPLASELRFKDWCQLSWHLARLQPATMTTISDHELLAFWSTLRRLSVDWSRQFGPAPATDEPSARLLRFEQTAGEVLVIDQAVRVLATVLVCRERSGKTSSSPGDGTPSIEPIFTHALELISHARHRLLQELVAAENEFSAVDRLRRRAERWTDLFIGPWIVRYGVAVFAYDPRRAWDYGEDALEDTEFPYQERLLHRSFQEAFCGRLLETRCANPDATPLHAQIVQWAGIEQKFQRQNVADSFGKLDDDQAALTSHEGEPPRQGPSALLEQCLRRRRPSQEN